MNKEVIYLEPEDDITDILTKLQQASQKLVALVPPKKATILRSAVNMKLVARVAGECEKIVVIVTTDPAIIKTAMTVRIPVAKSLNSRPVIPTAESVKTAAEEEQVIEEDADSGKKSPKSSPDASEMPLEGTESLSDASESDSANIIDIDDKSSEKASKPAKKPKKSPASGNFFVKYKKYFLIGTPIVLVLIIALVWAFVFAPAATISVAISSSSSNFSENAHFTTDAAAENAAEGTFLVEKRSLEQKYTTDFTATGEEDRGERATGEVLLQFVFTPRDYEDGFTLTVKDNEPFITSDGYRYLSDQSAQLSWNGEFPIACDNGSVTRSTGKCTFSIKMPVTAAKVGDDYNISAGTSWKDFGEFSVSNSSAFTGGTSHLVKIVSENDVKQAAEKQLSDNRDQGLKMIKSDVSSDAIALESSFEAEIVDQQATPAVGEVVEDGTTPKLTVTVRYTMYAVEKTKVDEYIKARTELSSDQQIYSISNIYFDRFTSIEDVARLKAVVETGPIVTEDLVFEKAHGRKVGEVQSQLRAISGVDSVNISTSFFWVNSIPDDRSKVTINIEGGHPEPAAASDSETSDSDANSNAATNASDLSSELEGQQ